jgi:mono/diheme cytochrome c family protein
MNLRQHLPSLSFLLVALAVLAGCVGAFVFTGAYNIGADAPHSRLVYSFTDQLRERSVASHSANIKVPADLNSPERIARGAGLYNEMCTGCHLGPGLEKSELSQGLYPQAPEFARGIDPTPAEQFWTIKHGVKLSAMPAWGKTHDDQLIWDMVAFIGKLPKMSPEQYRAAVASAPESHEEMMEHMPPMAGHNEQHDTASRPHSHAPGHGHNHSH